MSSIAFRGLMLAPLVPLGCNRSSADTSEVPGGDPAATTPNAAELRPVQARPMPLDIAGPSRAMPRGLTSFGAASAGGALYVLGGYFGKPHAYSHEGQSGELLRMDLESGQWTSLGQTERAQSVALVAHDDTLIAIGGMQARNDAGADPDLHSLTRAEAFDPQSETWTAVPPLPEPRSSHDAIVVGSTVWVVGGWNLDGEQRQWHETVVGLDLDAPDKGWVERRAPFKRRALAVAATTSKLVAIGGIDDARNLSQRVDVYDPATDRWTEGPAFPGPGFGVAATAVNETVFASGMDGVVHRWVIGEDAWHEHTTLAFPRFFHRLVATSDRDLLVLGGIRQMASGTRVRPIELVSTSVTREAPALLQFELRSPLPSKNRQGLALVGDTVLLFGGNKSLGQHDFGPEFFTDEAAKLDLASLSWSTMAPYPVARQTMSTFATSWGHVVSLGGFGHDGEVARSHPELYAYHPKKDEWRPIGSLPKQGRTQFGLSVRNDEVLLFGGLDYDPRRAKGDQFRHERGLLGAPIKTDGLVFTPAGGELREPRRAFAGSRIGDEYFIVGGMKEGFALVDTCEAYHLDEHTWRTIRCPERSRLSAQMVAMNGKLYLAAGSSKNGEGKLGPDPSLEVYDPKADRWTMVSEALPIEPKHVRMEVYGDRLVLLSTHNEDGRLDLLFVQP